mgnify:CR=1 FL=1|jgi:uncharacterized membrane protein HdeD (DUF308 family)
MSDIVKAATGQMITAAVLGIVLGALMLLYPGGTVVLMQSAFIVFKALLSLFIIFWVSSEAAGYFRVRSTMTGIGTVLLGALAVILIWSLGLGIVYLVVAAFLLISGTGEIVDSFRAPRGTFFLTLLGLIDIIIGILVITNPVILPLLIAWYVLFWGISRLLLALELRRLFSL